jgi:hypothetical protein
VQDLKGAIRVFCRIRWEEEERKVLEGRGRREGGGWQGVLPHQVGGGGEERVGGEVS